MIGKTHRFHGRRAIGRVYRSGQTVRGAYYALKYAKNPRSQGYRAAVVVSRKVHKSAVVRNRIRRRVYESLRLFEDRMGEPQDLVFLVYSSEVADIAFEKLQADMLQQLKKSGALRR